MINTRVVQKIMGSADKLPPAPPQEPTEVVPPVQETKPEPVVDDSKAKVSALEAKIAELEKKLSTPAEAPKEVVEEKPKTSFVAAPDVAKLKESLGLEDDQVEMLSTYFEGVLGPKISSVIEELLTERMASVEKFIPTIEEVDRVLQVNKFMGSNPEAWDYVSVMRDIVAESSDKSWTMEELFEEAKKRPKPVTKETSETKEEAVAEIANDPAVVANSTGGGETTVKQTQSVASNGRTDRAALRRNIAQRIVGE